MSSLSLLKLRGKLFLLKKCHTHGLVDLKIKPHLIHQKFLLHVTFIKYCDKKDATQKSSVKQETYEEELARLKAALNKIDEEYEVYKNTEPKQDTTKIRFIHIRRATVVIVLTLWGVLSFMGISRYLESNKAVRIFKSVNGLNIGGPFDLVDMDGNMFTEENIKGKYTLLYFGFINCPDICPETLEKISSILNMFTPYYLEHNLNCLFVTVDPKRDTPEALKEYLSDYHPHIKGLTGTVEQVQHMCKVYRAYGKISLKVTEDDYIVDHSIAILLLGKDGLVKKFVFRDVDSTEAVKDIKRIISKTIRDKNIEASKAKLN